MARVKICPSCGRQNPADEWFCVGVDCGVSISDVIPSEGRLALDRVMDGPMLRGDSPVGTVREAAPTNVFELLFEWGPATVTDRLQIGRDSDFSPFAELLAAYDTVSRRHAEIFVETGSLLVRHLGTTNPTYVNGRALDSSETVRLADGDKLGFSKAVIATVRLGTKR